MWPRVGAEGGRDWPGATPCRGLYTQFTVRRTNGKLGIVYMQSPTQSLPALGNPTLGQIACTDVYSGHLYLGSVPRISSRHKPQLTQYLLHPAGIASGRTAAAQTHLPGHQGQAGAGSWRVEVGVALCWMHSLNPAAPLAVGYEAAGCLLVCEMDGMHRYAF